MRNTRKKGSATCSPKFGKDNFISYFDSVNLSFYEYSWLGHKKDPIQDGTREFSFSLKEETITTHEVINNEYDNVNEEYSYASITTNWSNEQLVFDFYAKASAWASWINAYNAYAKTQLHIMSITFE